MYSVTVLPIEKYKETGLRYPVCMVVRNDGDTAIDIFFNSKIQSGIRFTPNEPDQVILINQPFFPSIEEERIRLESGEEYKVNLDLNRFVEFRGTGHFELRYDVTVKYCLADKDLSPKNIDFIRGRGVFKISVTPD